MLEETARRIRRYAGTDHELQGIARVLREEVPEYAEVKMTAAALKMSLYAAEMPMKGRDTLGRARWRP